MPTYLQGLNAFVEMWPLRHFPILDKFGLDPLGLVVPAVHALAPDPSFDAPRRLPVVKLVSGEIAPLLGLAVAFQSLLFPLLSKKMNVTQF